MDHIVTECRNNVLRIGFNRAERKNAITAAMYQALADALGAAGADRGVRVVLIHGSAEVFTAGNDLHDFLADPPRDASSPVFQFLHALSRFGKPVIAAVGGLAVGVGTTMLLHCDLVYCASGTQFSLPFVNLALCPEAASSLLLPRLAGYQRAAELLMTGEPFSAERAREIGLVNEIVPAERLLDAALAVAEKLAAKPPAALTATKALMKRWLTAPVEEAMAAEGETFLRQVLSAEATEAISAFFEKRTPDFSKFG